MCEFCTTDPSTPRGSMMLLGFKKSNMESYAIETGVPCEWPLWSTPGDRTDLPEGLKEWKLGRRRGE